MGVRQSEACDGHVIATEQGTPLVAGGKMDSLNDFAMCACAEGMNIVRTV